MRKLYKFWNGFVQTLPEYFLANETRNYDGESRSVFLEKLSGARAHHKEKKTHTHTQLFYCPYGNATSFFIAQALFFAGTEILNLTQ